MPPEQYVASLARKRVAAGAFLRDEAGRVLLVDPIYKRPWELPGGAVEADESPHAACHREVSEELGLNRPVGRVLALDWVPTRPERPEGLAVVYDGGVLVGSDVAMITLPPTELAAFAFVESDLVAERVTPLLSRRIDACFDAVAMRTVASLENGYPIG